MNADRRRRTNSRSMAMTATRSRNTTTEDSRTRTHITVCRPVVSLLLSSWIESLSTLGRSNVMNFRASSAICRTTDFENLVKSVEQDGFMDSLIRVLDEQGFRWVASVSSRPFVEPRAETHVYALGRRKGRGTPLLSSLPETLKGDTLTALATWADRCISQ